MLWAMIFIPILESELVYTVTVENFWKIWVYLAVNYWFFAMNWTIGESLMDL